MEWVRSRTRRFSGIWDHRAKCLRPTAGRRLASRHAQRQHENGLTRWDAMRGTGWHWKW